MHGASTVTPPDAVVGAEGRGRVWLFLLGCTQALPAHPRCCCSAGWLYCDGSGTAAGGGAAMAAQAFEVREGPVHACSCGGQSVLGLFVGHMALLLGSAVAVCDDEPELRADQWHEHDAAAH